MGLGVIAVKEITLRNASNDNTLSFSWWHGSDGEVEVCIKHFGRHTVNGICGRRAGRWCLWEAYVAPCGYSPILWDGFESLEDALCAIACALVRHGDGVYRIELEGGAA